MEHPPYPTFQSDLSQAKALKAKLDLAIKEAKKTGKIQEAEALAEETKKYIDQIEEKIIPKEIKANFTNPETNETKEIKINIQELIKNQQEFYQNHNLPNFNEQEVKQIFQKHKLEIQKEIETCGYDTVIIIPENLSDTEELNQKMTEGYAETYQSSNFQEGGGFAGAKTSESKKTKIILAHSDQNIYDNPQANIFAKQTLNKNIMQLSGLTEPEIQTRIQNNQPIPINFETQINSRTVRIQAEGFSLNEYLIFQRQYFKTTANHLDERGWTWLPKSRSASRVVDAYWFPGDGQLRVDANVFGSSSDDLGCRLSRSFELT